VGDLLDAETDYRWLLDDVSKPAIVSTFGKRRWVVDAVRKDRQVSHFRDEFGHTVDHVHLFASEEVLRARYEHRQQSGDDYVGDVPYEKAIQHPNEVSARSLIEIADHAIDIGLKTPAEAADEILAKIVEHRSL
jgi:adenylosuccinate synthase